MKENTDRHETCRHNSAASRSRHFLRRGWPALLALVLLGLAVTALSPRSEAEEKKAEPAAPQGLPVETAEVAVAPAVQRVTAVGTLQANEAVVITDEIAGRVVAIAFDEGQPVTAGQVLVRLDPSVLEAERDRAKANLTLSEANYRRAENLLKDQATSERERDEAYAHWRLDEANLRLAEAQLAKMEIVAPFAGLIGLRQVSLGKYLRPGDPVATLVDLDPIKVDFRVPEVFAHRLRVGQQIGLQVDAVPGRTFEGEVYAIDPQLDVNGRSVLLRARVENRNGPLRPGMFARVNLVLAQRLDALMIPEEALMAQGEQQLVYKVVDAKVVAAPVEIGIREKGRVEVVSGLTAGDTVITGGQIKVRPGMPVTALPPATGRPSGG